MQAIGKCSIAINRVSLSFITGFVLLSTAMASAKAELALADQALHSTASSPAPADVSEVAANFQSGVGNLIVPSSTLPTTDTADWSTLLDAPWKCGRQTGPRWEQWKKSVLLFAASSGFGFKGVCNFSATIDSQARPDTALIVFKDRNNIPQYVAWYDTRLDTVNNTIFGGITPLTAEIRYDVRYPYYKNYPLHAYNQAQLNEFYAYMVRISDVTQPDYNFQLHQETQTLFYRSIDRLKGCNPPNWSCGTGPITFASPGGNATLDITIFSEPTDPTAVGSLFEIREPEVEWYEKLVMVGITIGWTVIGGTIGEHIGLVSGTAEHAAFAAGFGGFNSGLIQGQDVGQALLTGLKGAGLAYTGTLILDAYGNPDALVGVAGAGCPTGDQCPIFQLANGFPPLKHLAELHDPFIGWSIHAFESVGQSAWYKAVTIPPFVVPGCLATAACVTAGIVIVNEDELP